MTRAHAASMMSQYCYVMGGTGFIKRRKLGERQATLNHRWNTMRLIGKSRAVPNDSPPPKRGAVGPSSLRASVHLDVGAADCSDGSCCVRVGRVGGEPVRQREHGGIEVDDASSIER